jgi:DNA-binding transcriptional ArsR family regulator
MNQQLRRFKAEFFKALGHPARLVILDQLRWGERSVQELQVALEMDQSSVSQQLAVLRNKNIVDSRKEGTTVYYRVRDPMIFQLLDLARAIFNNHLIDTQSMLAQLGEEAAEPAVGGGAADVSRER